MCCLQLSISVRSRTYHHSWFLSAYSPGISEGICIQIILRCFCYVIMKQKNVIKYVRTWTCSSVLYLLLRAVYLNQIPLFSSTFISTLVPGGFTDGNIIALSSSHLHIYRIAYLWGDYNKDFSHVEEITVNMCGLWRQQGAPSVQQLHSNLTFQRFFNHHHHHHRV